MAATNLLIAMNAVLPLFFYMVLGKVSVRLNICQEEFLTQLNRVIFHAFMPFVLFNNLYKLRNTQMSYSRLVLFGMVSFVVLLAVLMWIVPRLEPENPKRGVIIQALFRSNIIFYAIPLSESLFGTEGAALASLLVSVFSPAYNVGAVFVLEHFRESGETNTKSRGRMLADTLVQVIRNPMILGAAAGAVMALMPFSLPQFILTPVGTIASLATPLALFVLGGKFHMELERSYLKKVSLVLLAKLIVIPAVFLMALCLLRFSAAETFVLFSMYATPTATVSYAMAENMGGDATLAGNLVVLTTAASVPTLFLWIFLLKMIGII